MVVECEEWCRILCVGWLGVCVTSVLAVVGECAWEEYE